MTQARINKRQFYFTCQLENLNKIFIFLENEFFVCCINEFHAFSIIISLVWIIRSTFSKCQTWNFTSSKKISSNTLAATIIRILSSNTSDFVCIELKKE
ncbi:hypothetical protein BpHYR1_048398 [Brachionus plicatilis]|uniref:Uncharacterized protein n=1 Tax=Brachionus plicatilis TaxID=10195 RepID=A0A3M7P3J6_BRAPC|nr:hypothetical protein BpHYR1_048398 [Brachionus plicatilis]